MKRQVVLFGLDGATFTVLDDLVRRGVMPVLGRFMQSGARGKLMSVVPPVTPPAWTTLVTGRSPGHHGITNFLQFESDSSKYFRVITSRDVCCPTLWSMVDAAGGRAGSLNFVAHNPAPRINGYVVPGWVTWRWIKRYTHPAGLLERLSQTMPSLDLKELGMEFREERKAIAGAALDDYLPWIDLHIRRERQWFGIMRHQMIHDPCALVGVVFDGVDKIQHLCWPYLDPALEPAQPTDAFLQVRERCWDYFRQIDGFLAETLEIVGPDGHIFVVSDHGFAGSTEVLYINRWLEEQGYLTWSSEAEYTSDESNELGRARPYHLVNFDLEKTKAYAVLASNNGIHIPVQGERGPEGIPRERYHAVRQELMDALRHRCIDPETGERLITGIWTREEAFAGERMNVAPDLTLALRDHGFFSVLRGTTVLKKRPVVMGTHHPEGVFIGCGPGIRRGAEVDPLHLLDMAPTVLYALGLPIPEDLEGAVGSEMFTREHARTHAVRYGSTAARSMAPILDEVIDETANGGSGDDEEHEQILMRLKALGYMD